MPTVPEVAIFPPVSVMLMIRFWQWGRMRITFAVREKFASVSENLARKEPLRFAGEIVKSLY